MLQGLWIIFKEIASVGLNIESKLGGVVNTEQGLYLKAKPRDRKRGWTDIFARSNLAFDLMTSPDLAQ